MPAPISAPLPTSLPSPAAVAAPAPAPTAPPVTVPQPAPSVPTSARATNEEKTRLMDPHLTLLISHSMAASDVPPTPPGSVGVMKRGPGQDETALSGRPAVSRGSGRSLAR